MVNNEVRQRGAWSQNQENVTDQLGTKIETIEINFSHCSLPTSR